jgi:WD40 repeat protein
LVDGDLVLGKKINMTSLQSQLVVWNKLTGSLIHTLDPNQGSEIMTIDDTRFFASMQDGSIKAWLKSDGSFIGVFDCGETDPARALVEVNDILISGHKSGIIRGWEKNEKTVIQELIDPEQEKLEPITLLKIEAGFLICKSKNYIKIWSEKDRILLCTVGQGSSWMFDHDILYVGLETGCIEARDTKTGVIRFKLESSGGSEVTKIAINGTRLVALTKNGMEIWNLKTKVLMKSINDIAQFYLEDDRIIASAKGEIKIWDFLNLSYNSNV